MEDAFKQKLQPYKPRNHTQNMKKKKNVNFVCSPETDRQKEVLVWKIKGQNVLIRFSDAKELFITKLFLQNCGPHIVPSSVVWCSRKRIGTSEGKKTQLDYPWPHKWI